MVARVGLIPVGMGQVTVSTVVSLDSAVGPVRKRRGPLGGCDYDCDCDGDYCGADCDCDGDTGCTCDGEW